MKMSEKCRNKHNNNNNNSDDPLASRRTDGGEKPARKCSAFPGILKRLPDRATDEWIPPTPYVIYASLAAGSVSIYRKMDEWMDGACLRYQFVSCILN